VTPEAHTVLELRQQVSSTSVTKYQAIQRSEIKGWLYDTLQYCGAGRTGRWSGRVLQPQNLPRPKIPKAEIEDASELIAAGDLAALRARYPIVMDVLASCIRSAITAPPGCALGVCDLSSIESRVLGWLTGCRKINDTFAKGKDTYKVFAEDWLGIPYDQVDKETRTLCKPPTLGCGYGLGKGLQKYAESMGIPMTEDQCSSAVKIFRTVYKEVPAYWRYLDREAFEVVAIRRAGRTFTLEGDFLTARLPSGRKLYYQKPEWDQETDGLTYMGMDQYTHQWERLYTWGGKLIENLVQAIARDILLHGMRLIDTIYPVIGHIHDEVIALLAPGVDHDAALQFMTDCLSVTPSWAPGLILGAEGYVAKRYRKD